MAIVVAYEDAKANQRVSKSRFNDTDVNIVETPFLGKRGNQNLPLVILAAFDPGRYSSPHYHDTDQFQLMIQGNGKMGRHDIAANSLHFARAYTPYGPFVADSVSGLTCLIIRPRPDTGSQHSAEAMARLREMPNRRPWQVTTNAVFPTLAARNHLLHPVAGIQDNDGLAAYTLSMKPCTTVMTLDSSDGDGQFIVVARGSLLHDGRERKSLTVVYIAPHEREFEVRAGSEGLEGFVLRFSRSRTPTLFPVNPSNR